MQSYSELFIQAVNFTLDEEGGYSNNSDDPGEETKYGISKRSYPELDIANLTKDQAIAIYYRDFWAPELYQDIIYAPIAIKVFDLAVNIGSSTIHKLVQETLNKIDPNNILKVDGILGSISIKAINNITPKFLLDNIEATTAGYYRTIVYNNAADAQFLRGWLKRVYA